MRHLGGDKSGFSTHFVSTNPSDKKVLRSFFKSDRGYGASSPVFSVSFDSFSLRLYRQRKAAKDFCYQDLLDAFSFETIGTKEKALQKENADYRSSRWASAFEKAEQNNRTKLVRTSRQIKIERKIGIYGRDKKLVCF